MTGQTFSLLMQLGPKRDETRTIDGAEFVLGREPGSDWVIDDVEVSRKHARLIFQNDGYAIEDLGSTNGSYVNGQRIRSIVALEPGVTIRLGENVLLFYDAVMDKSAAEASSDDNKETAEIAPQVELIERVEPEAVASASAEVVEEKSEPSDPMVSTETPEIAELPEIQRRSVTEIPFYRKPFVIWIAAIGLLGVVALGAFLWYVDANFLWCDVFGGLIAGC
jgi:pSer/pThr/pTyr-binding forkhead associated (FHA) protein